MRTTAVPWVPVVAQWTLLGTLVGALVAAAAAVSGGAGRTGAVTGVAVAIACAAGGWLILARALVRHGRRELGPADHVTVTRGTLACVVAGLTTCLVVGPTVSAPPGSEPRYALVLLATVALALDAVDGWVARRTGTASDLGARLDMEVDAFLILVLSVAAAQTLGWWVLTIGLFRYALAVATWAAPWLGGTVPPRYWRKAVAALQGVALTVATARVLPEPLAFGVVVLALVLLAWSFGTQGAELWLAAAPRRAWAEKHPVALLASPPVVDAGRRAPRVRAAP